MSNSYFLLLPSLSQFSLLLPSISVSMEKFYVSGLSSSCRVRQLRKQMCNQCLSVFGDPVTGPCSSSRSRGTKIRFCGSPMSSIFKGIRNSVCLFPLFPPLHLFLEDFLKFGFSEPSETALNCASAMLTALPLLAT